MKNRCLCGVCPHASAPAARDGSQPRRRNYTDGGAYRERDPAMPRLFMITVPGLQVKSDWEAVHERLLDEFPQVTDVLATTMTATLLIVHQGDADIDAWLDGVSDAILSRRLSAARGARPNPSDSSRELSAEVQAGKELWFWGS